ncbi:DNA polymerase III, delta subunit [Pirellula staleyi DSM 6068]|uniref:DNA-directed DNA polymerase n=1 Tax=Pirellula staleyi (strain ATCC 27377 / DSM 6068 / ICPB 4128) TaxID=530564 RepID=D2QWI3_PIRSD|nr:DNA polymerase III subunit delta [Pirellula staleyi]ADB17786.1 DNA polymerase III, delta subunit [Pirellula staleyi DSM 6068]
MSRTITAFDFLAPGQKPASLSGICALFGDERFLRQLVLAKLVKLVTDSSGDDLYTKVDVSERPIAWRDIADELSTANLFGGGGARLVVLESADSWVSAHRAELEDWAAKSKPQGLLVLVVDEWPSNTRLYKAMDQSHLQVDCRLPQKAVGKNKVTDEGAICRWVVERAKSVYGIGLSQHASEKLLELTGPSMGMLDQDLAKLSLLAGGDGRVGVELVESAVGGWRAQSNWDLIDAALEGRAADAISQLEKLLHSGEHPLAIFGSLSWSLRRFAQAARHYQDAEDSGRRIQLREALTEAGFKEWPQGAMQKAEQRLIALGRKRAIALGQWLLEIDASLKGSHSHEDRARLLLESLFVRMARQNSAGSPARS